MNRKNRPTQEPRPSGRIDELDGTGDPIFRSIISDIKHRPRPRPELQPPQLEEQW